MLDMGQDLVGGEDNFRGIGRILDVIGQGFRDLCVPTNCAPVKDTNRRWVCPSLQFVLDRSVNQFSGRLEDENPVLFSDEFAGSLNYLFRLAGAAGSGTVFDTQMNADW